jgi:predicted nuclease of restriction endonuclease-like RecB superfamily
MLTADLIRPRLGQGGGKVWTRSLGVRDERYLNIATDLRALYRDHVGRRRGELEEALSDYEGESLDYPIIRGLAKTLSDGCYFASEPPLKPWALREHLFLRAAERGPVVGHPDLLHRTTRDDVIAETAAELGLSTQIVERALYADLNEEQVLQEVPRLSSLELIERYNLELARGLLYWASEMRIFVGDGYKNVFKFIKLFKLMHTIRETKETRNEPDRIGGYEITLDGPISPFVQATTRYGRQMAKFLPALLLCRNWKMEADIHIASPPGMRGTLKGPLLYRLDPRSGLRSHYQTSSPFDSKLEEDFAAEFEAKYSRARRQWELHREDEIIPLGDTVMIPDFSFTHVKDRRRALLEIVGFWHPNYLKRKVEKLRQAGRRDLIVLVYEGVKCSQQALAEVPGEVLFFKRKPILKEVLEAVERCAVSAPTGDQCDETGFAPSDSE